MNADELYNLQDDEENYVLDQDNIPELMEQYYKHRIKTDKCEWQEIRGNSINYRPGCPEFIAQKNSGYSIINKWGYFVYCPFCGKKIWIIGYNIAKDAANSESEREYRINENDISEKGADRSRDAEFTGDGGFTANSESEGLDWMYESKQYQTFGRGPGYNAESWIEAATRLCGVDDAHTGRLDGLTHAKHRNNRIKSLGNTIMWEIAYSIFNSIKQENIYTEKCIK